MGLCRTRAELGSCLHVGAMFWLSNAVFHSAAQFSAGRAVGWWSFVQKGTRTWVSPVCVLPPTIQPHGVDAYRSSRAGEKADAFILTAHAVLSHPFLLVGARKDGGRSAAAGLSSGKKREALPIHRQGPGTPTK